MNVPRNPPSHASRLYEAQRIDNEGSAANAPCPTLSPSCEDISVKRTKGGLGRDGGPQRLVALSQYLRSTEEALVKAFPDVLQSLPPGLVLATVRVVECAERNGGHHVTVEGLDMSSEWTLDLTETSQSFRVFPGKVIMVIGSLFGQNKMAVKSIIELPMVAAFAPSVLPGIIRHRILVCSGPFAEGPFVTKTLANFIAAAEIEMSTTILVLGPFVNIPTDLSIVSATFDDSYMGVMKHFSNIPFHVVMVGSTLDAIGDNVFPQPALQFRSDPDERSKLIVAPNPATIQINSSFRVGCCTVDSPRVMSQGLVEIVDVAALSRMHRVMGQIVGSGMFYPHYEQTDDTPLDVTSLPIQSFLDGIPPNLLITTTRLASSAGYLENGTVFLNVNSVSGPQTFFEVMVEGQRVVQIDEWKM